MTALDPRLAKVIALWRSTTHAGEKAAAQARAEALAAAAGMSFEEAVAAADTPAPDPRNIFAGFDDHMEAKEPGWKAQRAAEQAARRRENAKKRAAVIEKYGSVKAALAPCAREKLILIAVAPWRTKRKSPYARWTDKLDGWSGYGFERDKMPAHVLAAIEAAYPLPQTFAEAKAEHEHWKMRDDEMGLVLDASGLGYGDTSLDIATGVRAEMVRDQAEHLLPALTLKEVHQRFVLYRDLESMNETIEAALFRDIEKLALTEHLSSPIKVKPASVATHPPASTDRDGQIRAALDADPSRSDRDIARSCGCSPTTVGKVRRAIGLNGIVRSVHRGGQMFQMHFAFEDRSSAEALRHRESPL